MKKVKLGKTLEIAPIVLGGNVFGWSLDQAKSFEILDRFLELGFDTIDTADSYSSWVPANKGGESETIIGNWMKSRGNRSEVKIITKVGSAVGKPHRDVSSAYILEAAQASLERLQIEHIDFYLTHWDNQETPVEETLGAYDKLVKQGKVKHIGASNLSPARLKESLEVSRTQDLASYEILQPEYNLYDRQGYEENYQELSTKEGLGVIPYYSLASGFLAGKYRSEDDFEKSAARGGSMTKYLNVRGERILLVLDELAKKHEVSQAGISLGWLLDSPTITAPIASVTKESHFKAFMEAVNLNLDKEDIEKLLEASKY